MKVFIIGVGLIGGSLAKDLKSIGDFQITGIDKNKLNLNFALKDGIIDRLGKINEINKANIVILSVDVESAVDLLPKILTLINNNCLVIDFGSTKGKLCSLVSDHPKRNQFLATHPIAGKENSGPQHASSYLFKDKIQIICESNKTRKDLFDLAKSIFNQIGMNLRYMEPNENDKNMAYVSHLSHISSFMLGKTVLEIEKTKNIIDLAGSGFESTVRLAKSSPEMWAPIFKQNKKNVTKALDDYINNLLDFKKKILKNEFDDLKNQMKEINKLTKILNRNKQ
ncbi:MAG: prephenate dehydrogenase [Flavobacteriaceae bacterium]